ncbi:DNA-binding MarR family transcriptional regulator [Psychromicrobium silvestre]|uniref:DNA-binding MarR family transcriptional regulator n=1 Tax=Psychromicrobium silvestre TaxID=1645614 RepID=A0A7Y9LTP5_9MICC|nr:DNA-binding MarR family transcriptional regulator [Psychromicrobium silvestre]
MRTTEAELLDLAADFRNSLRQTVFLTRQLDLDSELSAAQLSVLNMMADGGLRVSAIAANLGVRVPSATESIKKLEAAGFLERRADPGDSRAVVVRLSEAGRQAAEKSNARRNQLMAELLEHLAPREREQLRTALPVISRLNNIMTTGN